MSISSLIGLAERLLSADFNPRSDTKKVNTKGTDVANSPNEAPNKGDRYTPSQVDAAAGANSIGSAATQQFERLRLSAFNITSQTAPPAIGATGNGNTAAPVVNAQPPAAVPLVAEPLVPLQTNATTTSATAAQANSAENEMGSLNAQLAALGLNPSEIQAIDQVAKLIQQFSPAAFQDLINQFNALANQATAANVAPTTNAVAPATNPTAAATPPVTTATTTLAATANATGNYQLTGISLKFTGFNETIHSPAQTNAALASKTQISAYNLQIQEVQVNLYNVGGQTVQVQSPQKAVAAAG
jgi:hypothetical protein